MRHYERPAAQSAHQTQLPHARHPAMQRNSGAPSNGAARLDGSSSIVGQMNQLYRRSPFMQRHGGAGGMQDDHPVAAATSAAAASEAIYSNLGGCLVLVFNLRMHSPKTRLFVSVFWSQIHPSTHYESQSGGLS